LEYKALHETEMEDKGPLSPKPNPFKFVMLSTSGKSLRFPVSKEILTYMFNLSHRLIFKAVEADSHEKPRILKRARVLVAIT
jgi:hypothetical protein